MPNLENVRQIFISIKFCDIAVKLLLPISNMTTIESRNMCYSDEKKNYMLVKNCAVEESSSTINDGKRNSILQIATALYL